MAAWVVPFDLSESVKRRSHRSELPQLPRQQSRTASLSTQRTSTAWSTKQFFVKDACLRKHVVPPSVRVLWFDDHLPHGIHPVDADAQVSIRVDGVFRPLFREYVCRFGMFGDVGFDGVSLAAVLWAQAPPEDDDGG